MLLQLYKQFDCYIEMPAFSCNMAGKIIEFR